MSVQEAPPAVPVRSSALPNVSLAREESRDDIYLVCGGTRLRIPSWPQFERFGFRPDKVRLVPAGALDRYVDKPFDPPAPILASDVWIKSCEAKRERKDHGIYPCDTYTDPVTTEDNYRHVQSPENLVRHDILLAGWLEHDVHVNVRPAGWCEDIHYELDLDPEFVARMYGPAGLSYALENEFYKGNPRINDDGAVARRYPVADHAWDGRRIGVTVNSLGLPGARTFIHGELNAWHVERAGGPFTAYIVGRGPAPPGWHRQDLTPHTGDVAWFPWPIFAPDGERLHKGDYVLMRGALWQDGAHGDTSIRSHWHVGETIGHEAEGFPLEMHPPDWIVKLRPRPPGQRKTVASAGCATPPGEDEVANDLPSAVKSGQFPKTRPTSLLSIRDVRELIDGRCSDVGTLIPPYDTTKPACADAGGDPPPRCQIIDGGTGVQLYPHVRGTRERQGRFKASYVISWREIDRLDEGWVDDGLPAGAVPAAEADTWNWIGENPGPYVGKLAHRSAQVAGVHQHYFSGASQKLAVRAGDTLFAMVYLDPAAPPAQVMLQWNDGTWDHRAYWGANLIGWGTDGTASRLRVGPLPEAADWVRLEVGAAAVGLAGRTLSGMAFTLYGGRATWDYAGVRRAVIVPNVLGATPGRASQAIRAAYLVPVFTGASGRRVYVARQSPTGGTTVQPGLKVTCTLEQGEPELGGTPAGS